MTLIPIFLVIQLAKCRLQADLDELIKQIPHEEMFEIRENYCRSVKFGEKSDFCQTTKDDLADGIPPGFLLLILSIIKEYFQKLSLSLVWDVPRIFQTDTDGRIRKSSSVDGQFVMKN